MKKDFLRNGNLVAFIAVVVINVLATFGIIGGVTTRDVSYMFHSLLTPADWAFSIWSVIYIFLAIVVCLQIKKSEIRDKMWYWFIVSCALNIAWIFAWQFKMIGLSFALILVLLLDLIVLMRSVRELGMLVNFSVGIYTGWINVAMLANLGALFNKLNLNWFGLGEQFWAITGLVFGIIWICFFLFSYKNVFYALGSCWGYLGIAMASGVFGIKITAIIGMIVFAGSGIFVLLRKKQLT